jgi:uncharacterized membrane protein (DUF2068 family)
MKSQRAIKFLAIFEALKGILVFAVGLRLINLIHRNVQLEAADIVRFFHLNPARHHPEIFATTLANLGNAQLWLLSISALIYSCIRFAEAYGLWYNLIWARWFAFASGALFLPMEIYELIERITYTRLSVFIFNLLLLIYLARTLRTNGVGK